MSKKSAVAEKILLPLVAAGTSAAAGVVMRKGPGFVEDTVLPRLRDWASEAGGAAEKLPDRAKSAVESTGGLASQLTERVRDLGPEDASGGVRGGGGLSQDELQQRSDERAKRRAKRRKSRS